MGRKTTYPYGAFEPAGAVPTREPERMAPLRGPWTALIESLVGMGEREMAWELCQIAARHGVWRDPLQRPALHYVSSAPAIPVLDASGFSFTAPLEAAYPRIRAEVDRVTDPAAAGFMPVEQRILAHGRWEQVVFYDNGVRFGGAAATFPEIARALDAIHRETPLPGLASLLWLHPGSRVVPHCGHTNSRLRVHLGIRVPEGVGMRVRDEVVTWEEGKVLVFDDSFEHEVWNVGERSRIILLFDIFNPAVPEGRRADEDRQQRPLEDKIRTFMTEHRLKRLERCDADALRSTLDDVTAKMVRRYMRHANIDAVELRGNDLRIQYSTSPASAPEPA